MLPKYPLELDTYTHREMRTTITKDEPRIQYGPLTRTILQMF